MGEDVGQDGGVFRVTDGLLDLYGEKRVRKMLPITLAFDHRIADGAHAARFMNGVVQRLSNPNQLFLEG